MGRIRVCDAPLPSELPETVEGFLRWLGGPALLRRRGRDPSRLRAVATLLHGNEPSGIRALHRWLASGQVPYAGAAIFIGSVEAALADPGFHHRALPGRRDLNRCFVPPCDGDEPEVAHEALALLDSLGPESLADLHNTSGETPPFALGPTLDAPHLAIAGCFCTRYVWSDLRIGSLVEATHAGYPSIVVECGRFADPAADEVAYRGLVRYLSEEPASSGPEPSREIFRSSVRVCLRPGLGLAFGEAPHPRADVTVMPALD
ncbi:MAG: succinylglutamate desuccinylase/aspartoacylase family protein, partial [Deltaproteobacteria bacterium]|nr:succinylglutamate desuccinylase/aspartoacylase family protein [Deltaproteobacteria bacterium]